MLRDNYEEYNPPAELLLEAYEKGEKIYYQSASAWREDERVASVLLKIAGDKEYAGRDRATRMLQHLKGIDASHFIYAFLLDEDCSIGLDLAWDVEKNDNGASIDTSVLFKMMETGSSKVRREVMYILDKLHGSDITEFMIKCLTDTDVYYRRTAAEYLGNCRSETAVEPLIAVLEDTELYVRYDAVLALGKIGDSAAVGPVQKLFSQEDLKLRVPAAAALYRLGDWSAEDIVQYRIDLEYIKDTADPNVSGVIDEMLEYCSDVDSDQSDFLEPLMEIARNKEHFGRSAALEDFWMFRDKRAYDFLLSIASDKNDPCREIALEHLSNYDDPAVIKLLLKVLREDNKIPYPYSDPIIASPFFLLEDLISKHLYKSNRNKASYDGEVSARFREELLGPSRDEIIALLKETFHSWIQAYEESFDSEKVRVLESLELLNADFTGLLLDAVECGNKRLREVAAVDLLYEGNKAGVQVLVDMIREYDLFIQAIMIPVRTFVLNPIPESVEPLIQLLEHESGNVRWAAAEALGYSNDDRAIEPIVHLLEDSDKWVRAIAAKALGELGAFQCSEELIKLLDDDSEHPRYRAAEALGRVGDLDTIPVLKSVLMDESFFVQTMAMSAIDRIMRRCAI